MEVPRLANVSSNWLHLLKGTALELKEVWISLVSWALLIV